MILFGGHGLDSVSVSTLYILDLVKMDSSQSPNNLNPIKGRSSMICSVSGDHFIVIGGKQ